MNLKCKLLLSAVFLSGTCLYAQEVELTAMDSVNQRVEILERIADVLQKIKLSGYIQAQSQFGEEYASLKVGGANENPGVSSFNRLGIRRGRVKTTYDSKYATGVLQLDITEKGVGIKDVYILAKDLLLNSQSSLKFGVFDRPFGYEISYSSSKRESPERATIFQTLFPDERDLGGMLTLQLAKTNPLSMFKLEACLFSGNGIKADVDNRKDFIGHVSATNTIGSTAKWGAGFSYYNGSVYSPTKYNYEMVGSKFTVDSSRSVGTFLKREYFGFDGQFSIDLPAIGITTLRAEYLWGTQPGLKESSKSPNYAALSETTGKDYTAGRFVRPFSGYYVYLIQDIGHTPFTAVLKYDCYDPNTKVNAENIGSAESPNSNYADLSYNTLGLGGLWKINQALRLQAFYEINKNEKAVNISSYSKDRKDDVFTLRLQCTF